MGKKFLVIMLMAGAPLIEASGIRGKITCRGTRDSAHVVVYVLSPGNPRDGNFPAAPKEAVMDQLNLTFVPHVLPVSRGTRVAFPNSDEVRHNVFSPSKAKRFNLGTYPQGVVKHVVFDQPGEVALLCNVHAEMSAYVIVLETPYFAVTDKQGHYQISNVPPGEYLLKTWHEKLPPAQRQVVVEKDRFVTVDLEMKR